MNIASRIRRSFFREKKKPVDGNSSTNGLSSRNGQGNDDFLGVTDELIEKVKSFSIDTFRNFPLDGNHEFDSRFC